VARRYKPEPAFVGFSRLVAEIENRTRQLKCARRDEERHLTDAMILATMMWLDMSGSFHPDEMLIHVVPKAVAALRRVARKEGIR